MISSNKTPSSSFYLESPETIVVVVNINQNITFINKKGSDILGLEDKEIIGKNWFDNFIPEDDRAPLIKSYENIFSGKSKELEYKETTILTKTKNERIIIWESMIVLKDKNGNNNAVLTSGTDQTERLKLQREKEAAEQSLWAIVQNNSDAMVVINHNGSVLFVNPAAVTLFGRKSEDFINSKFEFPVGSETKQEITLSHKESNIVTAEMNQQPIIWKGEKAYLASIRDITDHVRLREALQEMALIDELTGIYNRRGFVMLANQQLKLSNRTRRTMFLFFADLDNMKWINDNLGHLKGDEALKTIASIFKETFRESDIIARLGGDEFGVITIEASKDSKEILLARFKEKLNKANEAIDDYEISLSIGIALYNPETPCSIEELILRADQLMYEEKKKRKKGR